MKQIYIFFFAIVLMKGLPAMSNDVKISEQVRTYMSYTWPIDPTKVITLAEMDLSYALASTLVEWGSDKQIVGGLADEWKFINDKTVSLTLRSGLKWSDGSILTSEEVKKSFERGMELHPEDLRSLINLVESISCPNSQTIVFHLKSSSKDNNLLGKLTEPNYGVLNVVKNKALDLSKTTGPFFLKAGSADEIDLRPNPNFIHNSNNLAKAILIRRLAGDINPQEILLKNQWPNLIQISSLLPLSISKSYHDGGFEFWKRPTDRIFLFELSPKLYNETGKKLFKFLYTHVKREALLNGLDGYNLTDQIFPSGYQLHDPGFSATKVSSTELPQEFKSRAIEILYSPERVNPVLKANLEREITRVTGHAPKLISISMADLVPSYRKAQFDLYIGSVGLADPDPEGLMSYYLENDYKIIPEIGAGYIHRLDEARKQASDVERVRLMRSILTDSTIAGHVVPLFHLSTLGLARNEIDLSNIPTTDESVTLSKIRFRNVKK